MRNSVSVTITERLGNAEKTVDVAFYFDPANDGQGLLSTVESIAEPVLSRAAETRGRTRAVDGTVTDHALGLQWGKTLLDADGDPKRYTYAEAEAAAKALGEGWRLPSRVELLSLVDDTKHEPAIDTALFSDTQSSYYWTSTPAAWSPSSSAWIVVFDDGNASYFLRDGNAFVRAVRSVVAVPPGQ